MPHAQIDKIKTSDIIIFELIFDSKAVANTWKETEMTYIGDPSGIVYRANLPVPVAQEQVEDQPDQPGREPQPLTTEDRWKKQGWRTTYLLDDVQRRRRVLNAIMTWMLILVVATWAPSTLANGIAAPLLGLAAGLALSVAIHRFFLISVPEATGAMTINLFLRPTQEDGFLNQHVYPTGLNFKYWWEQAANSNQINLRNITHTFEVTVPAKDGIPITFKGSYQYRPYLGLLPRFIAVDESTIDQGVRDIIKSKLAQEIVNVTAEVARSEIARLQNTVSMVFEEGPSKDRRAVLKYELEYMYGIEILVVALAEPGFDNRFQQTLVSVERAQRIQATADRFQKGHDGKQRDITDSDALDAALVIDGNATKTIVTAGGSGAQGAASFLAALFHGGPENSRDRQ